MSQTEKTLSKSKRLVLKLAIGLLAFLIICTFVSRSIYTMLLPVVEVAKAEMKPLSSEAHMTGTLYYSDETNLMAKGTTTVLKVLVKQGDKVAKDAPLIEIDNSSYSIQEKRLKLAVMQIENQLKPNEMSKSEKAQVQLQLDIAKKELELFLLNCEIEKALSDGKYELEQMRLQEQSELTQAQLTAANAQWQKYWFAGAGIDHRDEVKLRQKIIAYQRQLRSTSLTDTKRTEIEALLDAAQLELDNLIANLPTDYDYVMESQYRAGVIQAQNNVLLLDEDLDEDEKNSVRLAYDLAQEEYRQYIQTSDVQNEISAQKLELNILQLENRLNPQNISESQKAAINLSLEIAKQELADFQASMPSDGIIKAEADCEIAGVAVADGDEIKSGDKLLTFRGAEAAPYVKWDASFDVGNNLSPATEITVNFKTQPTEREYFARQEMQTVRAETAIYDEASNRWRFSAKLNEFEGKVQSGSSAEVIMKTSTDVYLSVVPLACLKERDGKYSVMKVSTRNGLFSEESYVEEISVKVLEKDNLNAAIEADMLLSEDKIVRYSSKPLTNGAVVSMK